MDFVVYYFERSELHSWNSVPSVGGKDMLETLSQFCPVLRIRIRIRIHRIHMFLGLPDPDALVRGMDPDPDPALEPDPDPSIIMQK